MKTYNAEDKVIVSELVKLAGIEGVDDFLSDINEITLGRLSNL